MIKHAKPAWPFALSGGIFYKFGTNFVNINVVFTLPHAGKRQNTLKKEKGMIFLLAKKAWAKNTCKAKCARFGKMQNLPKRQKWQIGPGVSAILES